LDSPVLVGFLALIGLALLVACGFSGQMFHIPVISQFLGSPLQLKLHLTQLNTSLFQEFLSGDLTLLYIVWIPRASFEILVEASMTP
jgi:hypothetical protein